MNDTAGIRARIHESAIGRVTRMFAATLADIFAETLQNARRAGATRVRVALTGDPENGPVTVTVADDGDWHRRCRGAPVVRRERLERGSRAPRGRRRHGVSEPGPPGLRSLLAAPRT